MRGRLEMVELQISLDFSILNAGSRFVKQSFSPLLLLTLKLQTGSFAFDKINQHQSCPVHNVVLDGGESMVCGEVY